MFNSKVIDVLSQMQGMTNSVILKYPQTVAVSESQDMLILFDVSKLDTEEFPEIGMKNTFSDFLGMFKLFPEERSVTIDGVLVDVTAGDKQCTYITDVVALMDAYNKQPEQFEKTRIAPSVATFDLLADDIKDLKASSNIFKDLTEIIFTSKDSDVTVKLGATNRFNAKDNTFSVKKAAETSKEFEIKIPLDNFKAIPISDYTVFVKYNSSRNSYRILMENKNLEGFLILMSIKTA